ncbi:hypothetical protein EDB84DRAFT_223690 [Lactarius hengduanensis]|nr:hypothetical protein EDB84DRAFT_223690 [Lactarius hengduanensis]
MSFPIPCFIFYLYFRFHFVSSADKFWHCGHPLSTSFFRHRFCLRTPQPHSNSLLSRFDYPIFPLRLFSLKCRKSAFKWLVCILPEVPGPLCMSQAPFGGGVVTDYHIRKSVGLTLALE